MTDKPAETMLERCAKAVEQELGVQEMILADPVTLKRLQAARIAKAALEAIREPSDHMLGEGYLQLMDGHYWDREGPRAWKVMIDAILQGKA